MTHFKTPTRYIGITDFTGYTQVEMALQTLEKYRNRSDERRLRLHVGVMSSRKVLNGLETSWSGIHPSEEKVREIFTNPQTMRCMHYADYDGIDTSQNIRKALALGGDRTDALQLDMIWPDPEEIRLGIKHNNPGLEVILQVNSKAMESEGNSVRRVANRLTAYDGLISHVLLDKSGGKGEGLNARELLRYADAIADRFPQWGRVYAGGLGPDTTGLLGPILEQDPMASCDGQGQMRSSGDAKKPPEAERHHLYVKKTARLMSAT